MHSMETLLLKLHSRITGGLHLCLFWLGFRPFHSAPPTGWAKSISEIELFLCVRHQFEDDQYVETPITIHIL